MPLPSHGESRQVHQEQLAVMLLGIDTSTMDLAHRQALEKLHGRHFEFAEILYTEEQDLGCTDKIYHSIKARKEFPIKQGPHPPPFHLLSTKGRPAFV